MSRHNNPTHRGPRRKTLNHSLYSRATSPMRVQNRPASHPTTAGISSLLTRTPTGPLPDMTTTASPGTRDVPSPACVPLTPNLPTLTHCRFHSPLPGPPHFLFLPPTPPADPRASGSAMPAAWLRM